MRWFALFIAIWALVGCASQPGDGQGTSHAEVVAKAHTELAAAYYTRTQYGISLEELAKAIRADSSYAPAYNMRGLVNMALGEDAKAEEDFQRSLDLKSDNSDAQNNYGWFLCQRGREREAVKHFLIAANDPLYTTPEKAFLNAGMCSMKIGEMKDAETYLRRALILQPNMPEALAGLAETAFINGDFASAESYFSRFEQSSTSPMTAANLLLAVRIEHKLGNRRAESVYARQLKKNYPDSRETQLLGQIR